MEAYVRGNFTVGHMHADLADPAETILLAFAGDAPEPVGYAKLRTGDTDACVTGPDPIELHRLYVDRSALGHGVGAALMRACLDTARSRGFRTLWLGVWDRNARAIAFYEKWGFATVGEHEFVLGEDRQNDFIMQRATDRAGE